MFDVYDWPSVFFGIGIFAWFVFAYWYNKRAMKKYEARFWKGADDHARKMRAEERIDSVGKLESF